MAINLGVKALLNWVNSIQLSEQKLTTDDLQDGTVLLKVVYKLKKETISCSSNSIEDRFKLIADFVERDCRFSPDNGTSLSWDNIRDGINLTVEMAKVLLLLVYHDIMNDRCTLNKLDCDVEREIANLTGHFVMENESCVYLNAGLDAYLKRKSVTAPQELLARSTTTSSSSVSYSSLSDDESPLFNRKRKISFVDMHTVASSSVSNSPLQEIMNTPKFQMRKMQRQMIKDRDCRDGLERELASQLTLIAQRESHINKLQHRLDKLKEGQGDQEQAIKDQINELETKNNTLQMRLDEMLKQNKNFKSNTLLMERKVDELTDENGALSSQVRAVCSQLAIFEKEVGRLRETKASAQEEWMHKTSNLQSELNQATAQKELLTEQIQILQGKISCLEDEISRAAKEEVGENMGPVMEREMFETQISSLKNELESTVCSLKKAELDIPVKAQQLAEYQQEITRQKDLLKQQKSQSEQMIQAKDDILNKLQNEITEQRAGLHQEIQELKLQLEQIQHQKIEQVARLQQHIAACEQEVEKIKEIQREKEDLLHKTEQKLKDLETKFAAASSLLADKDKDINSLSEIVDNLTDETKRNQNEIQAKEEMLAKLLLEKSNEQDIFGNKILTITAQVEDLGLSLKQAEQKIQLKQDLLAKAQEENIQQREVLQQQIVTGEEEFQKLTEEIQVKNEQLVVLKNDSSRQSELLEEEIKDLKGQLEILNASLRKAEEQVQAQEAMLTNKEQESAHQTVVLQQKLLASEEMVRSMKEEIQTKEQHMMILKTDSSEQSELLHQNIQVLKTQVEHLSSSLIYAEENLQSKENMFAEQQLQSTQDIEDLQGQMVASQDEVKRLNADICAKVEQLTLLKTETSTHSEVLQKEIQTLKDQVHSLSESLKTLVEQVQAKENLLTQKEMEISEERDTFQNMMATSQEEMKGLREQLQAKEMELVTLEKEGSKHADMLQQEIERLQKQLTNMGDSLTRAEVTVQTQVHMLTKQEQESAHQKELLTASEEKVRKMKEEIQTKEEHIVLLTTDSSVKSELLHQEIQDLKTQVVCLNSTLNYAEENLQSKENLFADQQLQSTKDMEALQTQMVASQDEVKRLNSDICSKETQLTLLKTETSTDSEVLQKEIQTLTDQIHSLSESLKTTDEQVQAKENLLTQKEMEISEQKGKYQNMMATSEEEMKELREQIQAKEEQLVTLEKQGSEHSDMLHQELESVKKQVGNMGDSLTRAEETAQTQLGMLTKQEQESAHQKELLTAFEEKVRKMKEEIQTKEEQIMLLTTDGSEQSELLHHKIQDLKTEVEHLSSSLNHAEEDLQTKENLFADQKLQSTKDMDALQTQMVASQDEVKRLNVDICSKEAQLTLLKTETSTHSEVLQKEIQTLTDQVHSLSESLKSTVEQVQVSTLKEKEALAQEKEVLMARIVQGERDQKALNKQLEAMVFKKERLAQAKQAIEGENTASLKRESVLQKEVEVLKIEKEELLRVKEKADEIEMLKRDLQEQLSAKSDAVEHYKSQMEKAVSHYNDKKKLLQESQEDLAELKNTLDVKEREVKAITMENKMLQLDLDKVQTNEKKLESMVNILEAQLALADCNLRAQNKIHGNGSSATDVRRLEVPRAHSSFHTRVGVKRTMSSDSLDQSSLEDSLNTTRKLSAPDVSSTPLVRSSERVAAKRQASRTESLETLYFTPINNRRINRNGKEHNQELDSTRKDPTSSVKRRRTTQVINITLTKKTPGGSEESDETFYSLASARSQPNLSSAHSARPVAMEPFDTPAKTNGPASDQLIGLPGYRRSTIHAQPASTFCVGAENEPDGGPDDWMRIAELQSRNKACLPHLKSSYPVESEPCGGSAFSFTDEELRLGDPSDTFRRASMMPGQLQDTLTSHRHSLMVGPSGAAAGLRSHRLSLMPGQLPSRSVCSSQLRSPTGTKRSSTLSVHQTSPEKKVKASCFPRPVTPKNKNVTSRPASSTLRPALSPIDRRQSMMFSIDNTPTNQNYLKKGLNKLRSSTRKSPGKSSKKSPAQTSARMPSKSSHAGVGREGRIGSFKSPQAATKGQRKSPRTTSRAAKSPGLTASARKMMSRMKM